MHSAVNCSLHDGVKLMLIPFKKEHLEVMDIREHEKKIFRETNQLQALERCVAYTAVYDGRVVLCAGFALFGNGNAEIWMVPSIYMGEYIKPLCKTVRKWVEEQQKALFLRRMQTACMDDDLHNGWMRYLRFEREGTLRRYFDGKDYGMWGRIWE